MRRLLILTHRYLGIPLSVMFVVWFLSGIVMIYTEGFPTISETERLSRSPPLSLESVSLGPQAAAERAALVGGPAELLLTTVLGRPAYRFESYFGGSVTVLADTGEVIETVSPELAASAAAHYLQRSIDELQFIDTLFEPDQWTLLRRRELPLHLFSVDDSSATRVYVSVTTGEVELVTTRTSRFFAWIGVIPHWLYFKSFRANQPAWFWTIVVLSAVGCFLAGFGMILAYTQFRRSRPFSLKKSVRYRGWMRWHYFSGAIFGVFALTWAFSGMMSVEPFSWAVTEGFVLYEDELAGSELSPAAFPELAGPQGLTDHGRSLQQLNPARIQYQPILGEPHFIVTSVSTARAGSGIWESQRVVNARTLSVAEPDVDALIQVIETATPDASIASAELLDDYDAYYYAQDAQAPLPVLRVKFDDPDQSWYYIDPVQARVVRRTNRNRRIQRWMFNGLHSLDFSFWYRQRPLWDIGMITLSLGALLTSVIGMYLGIRRLFGLRR